MEEKNHEPREQRASKEALGRKSRGVGTRMSKGGDGGWRDQRAGDRSEPLSQAVVGVYLLMVVMQSLSHVRLLRPYGL